MGEYIKREEAIAYPLSWDHYDKAHGNRHFIAGVESYREYIEELQTADVVDVVRCKDCKHFEYDHPYIIQGVPVLGHEVCNAWGDGCKTDENGYCFMAERRTDG